MLCFSNHGVKETGNDGSGDADGTHARRGEGAGSIAVQGYRYILVATANSGFDVFILRGDDIAGMAWPSRRRIELIIFNAVSTLPAALDGVVAIFIGSIHTIPVSNIIRVFNMTIRIPNDYTIPAVPSTLSRIEPVITTAIAKIFGVDAYFAFGIRLPQNGIFSIAITAVPTALGCVVLIAIAHSVPNILAPITDTIISFNVTIRIGINDAVSGVPATLGCVRAINPAIANTVTNTVRILNVAIRIAINEAVTAVPAAFDGVVLSYVAIAVAKQRRGVNMAIRIALDNAISTVPAAFGLVEISALTVAIADILRCVDMTIGILIIEVKTVAAVPTTLDSVVISAVTVAVADPSSSAHDAIGKIFD